MQFSRRSQVLAVLAIFAAIAFIANRSWNGDDLTSSYIGCRLLAAGEPEHLYSRDAKFFDAVSDPLWLQIAAQSGLNSQALLHPYVQTPLWGYALEPLCTRTRYAAFHLIFLGLEITCFSACIWLAAAYWARGLFHPAWIALICLAFYPSVPVRYAFSLAQTHVIFMLLTVAALIFARRYPLLAGALLAIAAAVKITPAYLLVYWLLTQQKKAALSFVGCSTALVAATIATTGWSVFKAYLHNLSETSNVLLVSYNNQSFPAWLMSHRYPSSELTLWISHPLPAALKIVTIVLALACALGGGLLDRNAEGGPPYGAVFALIGVTMFTPIAWTHYYILLLLPVMLLLDAGLRRHSSALLAIVIVICALNMTPHRVLHYRMRSRFYAGAVSLAGLALARRHDEIAGEGRLDATG